MNAVHPDSFYHSLLPGLKPKKFFDGGGLFLFVSTSGAKQWRITYRVKGKAQTLSLGSLDRIPPADARSKLLECRAILKAGGNPSELLKAPPRFATSKNLPHDLLTNLLDYNQETGVFKWSVRNGPHISIGSIAGRVHENGYRRIGIAGEIYFAHRLAWFYVYGAWPTQQIDHINGLRDDNRIVNLRDVDAQTNTQNVRFEKKYEARHPGVRRTSIGKWAACISFNGKDVWSHGFDSPDGAHEMYLQLKKRLHDGFVGVA